METLRVRDDGDVLRVVFDRPHRQNAINDVLLAELHAVLDRAEKSPECRIVTLSGDGGVFCTASTAPRPGTTVRLLELVGLPATFAGRFPAQLSGGQRQRVTIARALAARPDLLVCDEMTSSLDAGVQEKVLDLVSDLRERLGLALVVITHDRAVLARLADRVLVLHEGVVCEEGPVERILNAPTHPWTRTLVAA